MKDVISFLEDVCNGTFFHNTTLEMKAITTNNCHKILGPIYKGLREIAVESYPLVEETLGNINDIIKKYTYKTVEN